MTVLGNVVLRAAKPANEKKRKTIATFSGNFAAFIERVEAREGGFVPVHCIVEVFAQLAYGSFAAQTIEGCFFN